MHELEVQLHQMNGGDQSINSSTTPHQHQHQQHQKQQVQQQQQLQQQQHNGHEDSSYYHNDEDSNNNVDKSIFSTPPRNFTPSRDLTPDRNSTPSRNYTPSYYSSTNSSPYSSYRSSRIINDIHDKLKSGSSTYRQKSNSSSNISMVSTSNNSYESTLAVAKASARFKHIYSNIPSQSITLNSNTDKLNNNSIVAVGGSRSSSSTVGIDKKHHQQHSTFDDRFNNLWSRYKQETGTSVDTMLSNSSNRLKDNNDQYHHHHHHSIPLNRTHNRYNNDEEKTNGVNTIDAHGIIDDNNDRNNIKSSTTTTVNHSMNEDHDYHHNENLSSINTPNSVSIDAYSSKDDAMTMLSPDAQEIYSDIGKLSEKIDTKLKTSSS